MNHASDSRPSSFSLWEWYTSARKRFWLRVISLLVTECFLFNQALISIAQEVNQSPPNFQQDEAPPGQQWPTEEQGSAEEPYQSPGTGTLPNIGWESPFFQSSDPEVNSDAQDIRDVVLSNDTPPVPATDINLYISVLDLSTVSTHLTEILYTYTDAPENEGILTEVKMKFENKSDDVESYSHDPSHPSVSHGANGAPVKVEFEYKRNDLDAIVYYEVDNAGNYVVDNEGAMNQVANENEGEALVLGIRLWYQDNTAKYAKFDYSTGTRQQEIYTETVDQDGNLLRWDHQYQLVVWEKTPSGIVTTYNYYWDNSMERIIAYEEISLGVTRHYENGEDQNLDNVSGEDLNNDGILQTDLSEDLDNDGILDIGEDLNGNGLLDLHINEDFNLNGQLDSEDADNDGIIAPWNLTWIQEVSGTSITMTYYQNGLILYKVMPDGTEWRYTYEFDNTGEIAATRLEERIHHAELYDNAGMVFIEIDNEPLSLLVLGEDQVEIDGVLLQKQTGENEAELEVELLSGTIVTFRLDVYGQLVAEVSGLSPFVIANTKQGFLIDEVELTTGQFILEKDYRLLQEDVTVTFEGGVYTLTIKNSSVQLTVEPNGTLAVGTQNIAPGNSYTIPGFGGIHDGTDYGFSETVDGGLTFHLTDYGQIMISLLNSEPITIGYTNAAAIPLGSRYYGGRVVRQDDDGNLIQEFDYGTNPAIISSYKYIKDIDGSISQTLVETNGVLSTYDDVNNLISVLINGVLTEFRQDGLEHKITFLDSGITIDFDYQPDLGDPSKILVKTETEHDPQYPSHDIVRVYDFQKDLLTSITDRNGFIREFEYVNTSYTEDLNNDGILNPEYSEDLNGNGILDTSYDEDLNNNGILDASYAEDLDNDGILDAGEDLNGNGQLDIIDEDVNNNGILDVGLNEDVNGNGLLDISVIEDRDNDGILDMLVISGSGRMVKDYNVYTINYYIERQSHTGGNQGNDLVFSDLEIRRTLIDGLTIVDATLTDDQLVAQGLLKSIDRNGSVRNFSYGTMVLNSVTRNISIETRPDLPNFELLKAYDANGRSVYEKFGDTITKFQYSGNISVETGEYTSGILIDGAVTRVFDGGGNLVSLTDRNGTVYNFDYEFDSLGNLFKSYETSETAGGQSLGILTRQFDTARNIVGTTDKNSIVRILELAFDEKGNQTGVIETDPRYPDRKIARTLNNDGRILLEITLGAGDIERTRSEFEYEFDPAGELRATIQKDINPNPPFTSTVTRRFNSRGDVVSITDTNGKVTHFSYVKDAKGTILETVITGEYKESDFWSSIPAYEIENKNYGFIVDENDGVNLTRSVFNKNISNEQGNFLLREEFYQGLTTNTVTQINDYVHNEIWNYFYNGSNQLERIEVNKMNQDFSVGTLDRTINYDAVTGKIQTIVHGNEYITDFVYSGSEIQSANVRFQNQSGQIVRSVVFQGGKIHRVALFDQSQSAVRWLEFSYRTVNEEGNFDIGGTFNVVDTITEYDNGSFANSDKTRSISHPAQSASGLPFTFPHQFSVLSEFENGTPSVIATYQTFNENGDIVTVTDEDGIITSYEYDKDLIGNTIRSREFSSEFPGVPLIRQFNTNGQVISTTTRNGFVTNYDNRPPDNEGRASSVAETTPAYPNASTVRIFNELGLIGSIDVNGTVTDFSYEFDSIGNILRSFSTDTHFPAAITTRQFDTETSNVESLTDAAGNVTRFFYNEDDILTSAQSFRVSDLVNPDRVTFFYTNGDEEGQVVRIEDNEGAVSRYFTYEFDSLGNMIRSHEYDGVKDGEFTGYEIVRNFDPDINIQLLQSDHNGVLTSFEYDGAGRLVSAHDTRGSITNFYTSGAFFGQVLSSSDTSGLVSTFNYDFDSTGNLSASFESAAGFPSAVTTRRFSSEGNLVSQTANNGSVTSFNYDADNNLISAYDTLGTVSFFYTEGTHVRQVARQENNGQVTGLFSYEFDSFGNLARSYETNGLFPAAVSTRQFDVSGNVETTTSARGIVASFDYENNILTSVYDNQDAVTTFYTGGVNRGQVNTVSSGGELDFSFNYEFDSNGNLIRSYQTDADFVQSIVTRKFDVATGNVETSTASNGSVSSFAYTPDNKLNQVIDDQGQVTRFYTAGQAQGQALNTSDSTGLISSFGYVFDSLGGLVTSYDTNGLFSAAVTTRQFNPDEGTIILSTDRNGIVASFNYDNDGVLVSVHDANFSVTTFYTDGIAEGQVASQSDSAGPTAYLSYDIDTLTGSLIASYETNAQILAAVTTRHFNTSTGNLSTQTDKNGVVSSFDFNNGILISVNDTNLNISRFYTTGTVRSQLASQSDAAGPAAYYSYEIDSLGNIVRSYETSASLPAVLTTRAFDVAEGNVTTVTDKNGSISSFTYDNDMLISVFDDQGNVTLFYTSGIVQGQVYQQSDSLGLQNTFSYEFDSLGNLLRSYQSEGTFSGAVTTRFFDAANTTIQTSTDKNGSVSSFSYVGDVLLSIYDDRSNITSFYTAAGVKQGQVESTADAGGLSALFDYEIDSLGNISKSYQTDASLPLAIVTRAFDIVAGDVLTSTDKNGVVSSFHYVSGQLVSIADAQQNVTEFYTSGADRGQVYQTSDTTGLQSQFSYQFDSLGNLLRSFETDAQFTAAYTTRTFDIQSGTIRTTTDRNGGISSFYYTGDVLSSITTDDGDVTTFYTANKERGQVYDSTVAGQLVAVFSYDIDDIGNLVRSYQTDGQIPAAITTRLFDTMTGNVLTSTDKNGLISSFHYANGDISSILDSRGNITVFYTSSDALGQVFETSDNSGLLSQFTYGIDSLGNLSRSYQTDGNLPNAVTTRRYDSDGQLVLTSTDKNGSVSSFYYTAQNQLVSVLDDENNLTNFFTIGVEAGQVSSQSDSDGLTAVFSYSFDSLGNLEKSYQTDADFNAAVTTRVFDVASGNIDTSTDANGSISSFFYDGSTLVSLVDSLDNLTRFYTDGNQRGNVSETSNVGGPVNYFTYQVDSLGNLIRSYQTDANFPASITTRQFNIPDTTILTSTDRNGVVSSFNYLNNVLVSIESTAGDVTAFYTSGDAQGQVYQTSDTTGLQSQFSYQFDSLGNLLRSFETDAEFPASLSTRQFDPIVGNIETSTDKNGVVSSFYYTGSQLASIANDQGGITEFYTSSQVVGQVRATSDSTGLQAIFTYDMDSLGNIVKSYQTDPAFPQAIQTRSFDAGTNNIITATDKNGNISSFTYANGRLASVVDTQNNITVFYTVDEWEGQIKETSDSAGAVGSFSYALDLLGNLVRSYQTDAQFPAALITRQFDAGLGNIDSVTDKNGIVSDFHYVSGNTLNSIEQFGIGGVQVTNFYTSGNARSQVLSTADNDGLINRFSYEFDILGNLIRSYQTDLRNGNAVTTRRFNASNGNILTTTNGIGRINSFYYDNDALSSLTDDRGNITEFYTSGSAQGQIRRTSNALALLSNFSYAFDSLGNLINSYETAQRFGLLTTRHFDPQSSNLITSTDHFGTVSSFHYTASNKLASVETSDNAVTKFYTSGTFQGQISEISNNNALTNSFTYELSLGAIVRSYDTADGIAGNVTTRKFNQLAGVVETSTDRFGTVSSFNYDSLDNLVSIYDTRNNVTRFYTSGAGDDEGQIFSSERGGRLLSQFSYEIDLGRVIRSYDTDQGLAGRVTTRHFDTNTGNIDTSTDRFGRVSTFIYDTNDDKLVSVYDTQNNITNFYTSGDWDGQVKDTSRNGSLTSVFSYEISGP
ncbi:RHS repeat protein, partial [bacterium]|nr:RHS repeat protein [bacterium]